MSTIPALRCVCLAVFLLIPAGALRAQSSDDLTTAPAWRFPGPAVNRLMPDMIFQPTPGVPFSAKSVATLTMTDCKATLQYGFFSMVARSSSGRLYFENRRPIPNAGDEPAPRIYFILIDPGEHTRTICYLATKTCRINAFRHISVDASDTPDGTPAAATTAVSDLGSRTVDSMEATGTLTTTTIAAGAYGNQHPIIATRETWHSTALDVDVLTIRTNPRWGKETRELVDISLGEPDQDYFSIPADYKLLDNRPSK
ncbi:MAG: hypothetical protein WBG54_06735 [Acidobacteriaceae bacterium]